MSPVVTSVAVGDIPGSMMTTRVPTLQCTWEGVAGDLHGGWLRKAEARVPWYKRGTPMRNERQVTLVSSEVLAATAQLMALPHIAPEWLGANVMVSGLPQFTALPPTTRLVFAGGAVLVVWNENLPCIQPGRVIEQQVADRPGIAALYPKHALHKRGLVAVVEIPGLISTGDTIDIHLPKGYAWQRDDAPWRAL